MALLTAATLAAQSAATGADPTVAAHKGWRLIEAEIDGDTRLLAAGISDDNDLVAVTERAVYVARPVLLFDTCWKYLHGSVDRYELRGLFTTRLRLHTGKGIHVDLQALAGETDYPVHTAIIHLWHERKLEHKMREVITPHVEVLAWKRRELLVLDDYGADRSAWDMEIQGFFRDVVVPQLRREVTNADLEYLLVSIGAWVDSIIDEWAAGQAAAAACRIRNTHIIPHDSGVSSYVPRQILLQ